jgi:hypothetical protein
MRSWLLLAVAACAPEPLPDRQPADPIDTDDADPADTDEAPGDSDPETGDPLDPLVGRTWQLEVGTITVTEPTNLANALEDSIRGRWFVTVTAADGDSIEGFLARGELDYVEQEMCARTLAFPTLERVGANAVSGPLDGEIPFEGQAVPVHALSISATVAGGGATLVDVSVQGNVDTRDLAWIMGSEDPGAICDYVADRGDKCSVCPDGEAWCLPMRAEQMTLSEVGLDLVPIEAPSCAEEAPMCGCATRSPAGGLLGLLLAISGTWARCARTSRSRCP